MIFILILVLSVFDYEPHTITVAKTVGIELGTHIPVFATDVVVAVVALDENTISVISAILIKVLYLLSFFL